MPFNNETQATPTGAADLHYPHANVVPPLSSLAQCPEPTDRTKTAWSKFGATKASLSPYHHPEPIAHKDAKSEISSFQPESIQSKTKNALKSFKERWWPPAELVELFPEFAVETR
jgi:hypothetical protein